MAQVTWSQPALEDLGAIADYISLDDPRAARRLVQKVFAKVELLRAQPELGSRPRELRGTVYRHLVVQPFRIFYRVAGRRVFIVYVMRGEREFKLAGLHRRE